MQERDENNYDSVSCTGDLLFHSNSTVTITESDAYDILSYNRIQNIEGSLRNRSVTVNGFIFNRNVSALNGKQNSAARQQTRYIYVRTKCPS